MRDFTIEIYRLLLETLKKRNYTFLTFADFIENESLLINTHSSLVISRHDVDLLPDYALTVAKLEYELGIKGTYYFRIIPETFKVEIIKEIASLGHEIGYHYEEVDFARRQISGKWSMLNGKYKKKSKKSLPTTDNPLPEITDLAYELFKENLEKMRRVVPVTTICMHGSPLSPYDNKMIWTKYDYKDLGIIGEPYYDIDWTQFAYLTDTGRCWNGSEVSVRDKVDSKFKFYFKSSYDIIKNIDLLPDKIMITIHPQRWSNNPISWLEELVLQNMKNTIKRLIVKK